MPGRLAPQPLGHLLFNPLQDGQHDRTGRTGALLLQTDGPPQGLSSTTFVLEFQLGQAQFIPGPGEPGLQLHAALLRSLRLALATERCHGTPQHVVAEGKAWLQLDRPLRQAHGLARLAQFQIGLGQEVERVSQEGIIPMQAGQMHTEHAAQLHPLALLIELAGEALEQHGIARVVVQLPQQILTGLLK